MPFTWEASSTDYPNQNNIKNAAQDLGGVFIKPDMMTCEIPGCDYFLYFDQSTLCMSLVSLNA